jgi:hypothetical protein
MRNLPPHKWSLLPSQACLSTGAGYGPPQPHQQPPPPVMQSAGQQHSELQQQPDEGLSQPLPGEEPQRASLDAGRHAAQDAPAASSLDIGHTASQSTVRTSLDVPTPAQPEQEGQQ